LLLGEHGIEGGLAKICVARVVDLAEGAGLIAVVIDLQPDPRSL
jgi:hypothetical protein